MQVVKLGMIPRGAATTNFDFQSTGHEELLRILLAVRLWGKR
jgi:hypothetical protein